MAQLPKALRAFCQRPLADRREYLQSRYRVAFDGYSYPGQEDSCNQGPQDQLHSFVFSDFSPREHYPLELQAFIRCRWAVLCRQVQALEQAILQDLGLAAIARQHRRHFGHMMSANYYPPPDQPGAGTPGLRLSAHPDVSLLTVFIQGLGPGFQYRDTDGAWRDAPLVPRVTVFAGELLEWLTNGAIPALQHRVRAQAGGDERFSFALFSLPRPGAVVARPGGASITTEDWYRLHLNQWDAAYNHQEMSRP
ncbi:2OG-Fe(II) oxygenase family protein [Seongchinamella sediminis]|uniref:2OG-Fe(II) oxygenase family protein n=1 Tax=Seongchinamella sediminis TaxID=2283635 RepID=UPI0013C379DB|nr:2OG-Fe(II) oxygenase family protein [Seongchinamella sediminis]